MPNLWSVRPADSEHVFDIDGGIVNRAVDRAAAAQDLDRPELLVAL